MFYDTHKKKGERGGGCIRCDVGGADADACDDVVMRRSQGGVVVVVVSLYNWSGTRAGGAAAWAKAAVGPRVKETCENNSPPHTQTLIRPFHHLFFGMSNRL